MIDILVVFLSLAVSTPPLINAPSNYKGYYTGSMIFQQRQSRSAYNILIQEMLKHDICLK